MIKIGKIYINIFIFPLIIAAYLTFSIPQLVISYAVAFVHEFSHYIGAKHYKIETGGFVIMPFGLSLRLKDRLIENPVHECIICALGPLSNLLMAVFGVYIRTHFDMNLNLVDFFILSNASMLIINIIPIIPLDGGRIVRASLTHKTGFAKACSITAALSQIFILLLGVLSIYVLYTTHFNVSLTIICAFLLFNMSAERKNDNLTVMRQIVYSKEKLARRRFMNVKWIALREGADTREVLKNFSYNNYYIVSIMDKNCRIQSIMTETQIIETLLKGNKKINSNIFSANLPEDIVLKKKIC